jgi:LysM repeat protein
MRVRTRSACVVLAWGIIVLIVLAVGSSGSVRPAQANIRIASSISNTSSKTTGTTRATLTSSVTTAPAARPHKGTAGLAARAAVGRYVVRPGDTLSGIAAALGVRGGWPALYAANRPVVGPDPGLISPGTVLTLPGQTASARYTVAADDTLSGIAAALGTPGGWPALYAANRRVIGTDPNAIHAGTVLVIPRRTPARPTSAAPQGAPSGSPAPRPAPTVPAKNAPVPPPASAPAPAPASATPARARSTSLAQSSAPPWQPASTRPATKASARRPARQALPNPLASAGLPRWLEIVLVAAGLLIGIAFLTEPTLAIARRRRAARLASAGARIVLADYDRLVVTLCGTDGTVCVLRPPGADPEEILLAARLVLAQDRYEELAGHLGVRAHWPRE